MTCKAGKKFFSYTEKTCATVGSCTLDILAETGRSVRFFYSVLYYSFHTPIKVQKLIEQIKMLGFYSLVIIILTGAFAGGVLALQLCSNIQQFGSQELVGPIIGYSIARELAPVLTGLMVAGRVGSAMAAEIGTMRITEQLDALQTLSLNVWQYLIIPRIWATTIAMPLLTLFAMLFGVIGGGIVCAYELQISSELYFSGMQKYISMHDIYHGLIKALIFGLLISWTSCYRGYYTSGGSHGVGTATTKAVVISSILVLISNYFLTLLLFE